MTKNFSLVQMQYALAVEEKGNFIQASKACRVTQPTLSMQIQKLEEELGIRLFDRTKQPIVATLEGSAALAQMKLIVHESRRLESITARSSESQKDHELTGEFSIGVIPTLALDLMPLWISEFRKKFPKISLKLIEAKTEELIRKLKNDELDAAFCATPLGEEGLQEMPLLYEPFWVYLPPGHQLAGSKVISQDELDLAELLVLQEGHCFRGQALEICHAGRGETQFRFESGSLEVLKTLVDQGLGLTLLPELSADRLLGDLKHSRLKAFGPNGPSREVSLVTARMFSKKRLVDEVFATVSKKIPTSLRKKSKNIVPLRG